MSLTGSFVGYILLIFLCFFIQPTPTGKAWPDVHGIRLSSNNLVPPPTNHLAGSVQVLSSTNGELGPSEGSHMEPRLGPHLNTTQPEVEVVEETK